MTRASSISLSLPDGWTMGGVTNWSLMMAGLLVERGWQVNLLVHRNPSVKPLPCPDGVRVIEVGGYSAWNPRYLWMPEFVKAYESVLPTVFIPSSSSGTYAACAELAKTRAKDMRVIGVLHSDWEGSYAWAVYYRWMMQTVIADSLDIELKLKGKLAGKKRQSRIVYRPHPVLTPECLDRSEMASDQPIRIIYSGRMQEEQKRFTDVLRVARILAEQKCHFVLDVYGRGTAADEERYKALATEWLADQSNRVCFRGAISQEQMFREWETCDVNLMTSDYEGLSQTMIESMSRGAAQALTRVSGVRDLVDDACGVVCDVGDVAGLARGIMALERDRGRLQKMGVEARLRTKERCDLPGYVDWLAGLCEQAWEDPPRHWPRWKPTICMTQTMKEAGFDPGPANWMQKTDRKFRRWFDGLVKNSVDLCVKK